MNSKKYDSRMLSLQNVKKGGKNSDNAIIKDISDINAYSTPTQISSFVSFKMKEFMKCQLSENAPTQSATGNS